MGFAWAAQDSDLTASSELTDTYSRGPDRSRLFTQAHELPMASGAWRAAGNQPGEWIQMDMQGIKVVGKVATQGRHETVYTNDFEWVTSYQLKYSLTSMEADFGYVKSSADGSVVTFPGNFDRNTIVANGFDPITGRYIRLYPTAWNNHISMRWEVYGCDAPVFM